MYVEISHRPDQKQFIATVEGKDSILRYFPVGESTLDLVSTFVHRDLRGRGVGEKLVQRALDYARREGLQVIPTCWFVGTVMEQHPEYKDLVAST